MSLGRVISNLAADLPVEIDLKPKPSPALPVEIDLSPAVSRTLRFEIDLNPEPLHTLPVEIDLDPEPSRTLPAEIDLNPAPPGTLPAEIHLKSRPIHLPEYLRPRRAFPRRTRCIPRRHPSEVPMPKSKPSTPSSAQAPPVYTPAAGKKALAALAPAIAALSPADLATRKLDVEAATYAALGVAGFIAEPKVHARFASFPKKEFDIAHVDGLAPACFATLYAIAEARAAGALETNVKVAPELVAEATLVETRMAALCEYQLGDDPVIKPELDRLRPGIGHRDLANDLLGYARIYELRRDVVKTDAKHYRPGDAARARDLAGAILQALSASMTPKARAAYDRYARAWTVLFGHYDEVRAAGLWLYRKDPQREARFPSLFAVGRPSSGPKKKAAEEPPADEGGTASPPEK